MLGTLEGVLAKVEELGEPENNERSRRPTPDELERILAAADGYLRDYLIVKLDTGLRRKGLLHLQLKHVRWGGAGNGVLDLPPRLLKQGKRQLIPMTLAVRAVMERRRTQLEGKRLGEDAFVFGDADGNGYKSATPVMDRWYAALKKAGIRDPERGIDLDLHEHDLRGECASRLKDQGIAVSMIQRYLGHSSLTMTQRYLRPRVGELEEAAEALDSYATGPTSGPTVAALAEEIDGDQNSVLEVDEELRSGGPRWDRTSDTVIKRLVLMPIRTDQTALLQANPDHT